MTRSSPRKAGWLIAAAVAQPFCAQAQATAPVPESQTMGAAPARPQPAPAERPGNELPRLPHVDRVLDEGPQNDAAADDASTYDETGWSRGLRLEYGLGITRGIGRTRTDLLRADAWIDTPDYGTLSLSAGGDRIGPGGATLSDGLRWRVDQRALPLDGGWQGNHSGGDTAAFMPPLVQGIGRVLLPPTALRGLSGSWNRGDQAFLNAAAGKAARFLYSQDPATEDRGNFSLATAGGQWMLSGTPGNEAAGRTDIAAQVLRDHAPQPEGGDVSAQWMAANWQGQAPWADRLGSATPGEGIERRVGGLRVTGQVLNSWDDFVHSQGLWADAAWRSQELQQAAGLYRFEPGLRWGQLSMPGDLQGAYWRGEIATRLWQVGGTLEANTSITGRSDPGNFLHAWGRWRTDATSAISASVAQRTGDAWGRSVQAGWEVGTDWAALMFRASMLQRRRSEILTLSSDQSWNLPAGWALSTSLALERETLGSARIDRTQWGIVAAYAMFGGPTFDLGLRGSHGGNQRSLNGSLSMNWPIQNGWSFAARAFVANGREPQLQEVRSALTPDLLLPPVPTTKGIQFSLRYETRAGTRTAPLGGGVGSGAGQLSGTVFFDQNGNGQREASELPAAGVIVVLDNRYTTRTDSQGRFEFPAVVAGRHGVTVQHDNLPLPWSLQSREPVSVEVGVRSTATLDFALQRDR